MASIPLRTEMDKALGMAELVREILRSLDEVAGLEAIWKRGVVHPGGPHYRLKGTLGPVSLGVDECLVFGKLIEEFKPVNCFIIGNAFGMSSVFIAKMMELSGGNSVITLDSKSEGDGDRCYAAAASLKDRMKCRILNNKWGWSPQDVEKSVESSHYDLIFIDGDHSHPQVTRDFHAVKRFAGENSILCWHDYWMAGVPESVAEAQQAGYHCIKVNTSCEMVFGTKSKSVFQRIQALFPNTEEPRPRSRPLAWLKLYNALCAGAIKAYLLRQR